MCNVRFMGCLHLGHKWMANHRGFQDEFYHDENLIASWNSVVNKKDLTYIVGDVTMEKKEHYYQLDRLNGRKIVVLGNHDMPQHIPELLKYVETVAGMVDYKGCTITHCPIHPSEIGFYRANIHAHIHENPLVEVYASDKYEDPDKTILPTLHKYVNVDAWMVGFKPQTLEQVLAKVQHKQEQMEKQREAVLQNAILTMRTSR